MIRLLLSFAFALSPIAIYQNNKGVNQIVGEGKLDPAYYNPLIQDHPEQWIFYWNQALASITNKDLAAATQTLNWLASMLPPNEELLRFEVYYQLGRIYAEEKKVVEALGAYQKALDIFPDSKEVTVNMELLIQGGGGGSDGENEEQDKNKDQQQQKDGQDNKPKEEDPNKDDKGPKPTPKPFDSKDLSKEDVRRILDELKRQEEQIRAKIDENKPKEQGLGKDW
jgi:tetratricopeptide (TPR) repeat protein